MEKKYLKYKKKYIELKKLKGGAEEKTEGVAEEKTEGVAEEKTEGVAEIKHPPEIKLRELRESLPSVLVPLVEQYEEQFEEQKKNTLYGKFLTTLVSFEAPYTKEKYKNALKIILNTAVIEDGDDIIVKYTNELRKILNIEDKKDDKDDKKYIRWIYVDDENKKKVKSRIKDLNKLNESYKHIYFYGPVTDLGNNWLRSCTHLETVNYSCLYNLRSVGNKWMYGCYSLRTVDFDGLSNLQSVGNKWMEHCHILQRVNFTNLSGLQSVGNNWLRKCYNLTTANFTNLSSLRSVGDGWMGDYTDLDNVVQNVNFTNSQFLKRKYDAEILHLHIQKYQEWEPEEDFHGAW
jgi:hypothetical protein